MGEWTTEQIKELLIDELGLDPLMVDAWLTAHDAEVAREAAEKAWARGNAAGYQDCYEYHWGDGDCGPHWWDCDCPNPYRKPEPSKPFDTDAQLAADGLPPFPTIRKEDHNG